MADGSAGLAAGFLRLVLKLFLAAIALVFAVCLLAVGLIAVLFSLLKALITWQKPAPWVVFRRVQQYSTRGQWPANRGSRGDMNGAVNDDNLDTNQRGSSSGNMTGFPTRSRQNARSADVVDVEVREVPPADGKG